MKRFYLACISILMVVSSVAQDSTLLKRVTYKSAITFTDKRVERDYLLDVTDTSLLIVHLPAKFRREGMYVTATPVPYMQIETLTLRRKGSTGRGALFGLISGVTLGGIIGAITHKECEDCFLNFGIGFDIGVGAFLGSVGGTLTGMLIGSLVKKRFVINGDKQKFEEMKLSVLDMAYRKQKR